MPRSKEIQEEMRKKVIEIYQSGKGHKAISKAVGLQRTTVRAIIHKWRKLGTVANLPRSGRPAKITPRVRWRLIQEVTKEPRKTSKELQALLATVKGSVHDSTIRKTLAKNGIHGRVPRRKPLLSQKNTGVVSHLPKSILIILKTFGETFCGQMSQKFNFLEGVQPVTSGVKMAQHLTKEHDANSKAWWWQCDRLGLLCCLRTRTTCCDWRNNEFWCLPEDPEGERLAISSCPQTQALLDHAAGQRSKTHQQVHLWVAHKKQN